MKGNRKGIKLSQRGKTFVKFTRPRISAQVPPPTPTSRPWVRVLAMFPNSGLGPGT